MGQPPSPAPFCPPALGPGAVSGSMQKGRERAPDFWLEVLEGMSQGAVVFQGEYREGRDEVSDPVK